MPIDNRPGGSPQGLDFTDKARLQEIDRSVGLRLRGRRVSLGLSQSALAEQVGLTFQQIQKFENGTNRMKASQLYACGRVLDVPVDFFFGDVTAGGVVEPQLPTDRLELETLRLFKRCAPGLRQQIHEIVRILARTALVAPDVPARPAPIAYDHEPLDLPILPRPSREAAE